MPRLLVFALVVALAIAASAQAAPPQSSDTTLVVPPGFRAQVPDPTASAHDLEVQGDALRAEKGYADSIDFYQAALKKDPNRAMLWNKIGIAQIRLTRFDDAKKSFERALKLDKDLADAMGNLGATYYLEKNYSKSIKTCRKAIAMRPDSASFHSNLANAFFARKEYDKAFAEYSKAIELDPDIMERQSGSGVQAHVIGAQDRARYSYELAKVYARLGNYDRAFHYLKKAIEDGFPQIKSVYKDQEFAGLRKDPRFTELMSSMPQAIPQ